MAESSHCFYCREDLGGKRFIRSEGKPVCVRCHTKFCANNCAECHRPISVETKELSHKGRYWHEECFRCTKCYKPLAKEPFSTKEDRIMCGKCCSREDAPRCHGCYKPILAGTESVEYKGNSWHDECFVCCNCKRPIGSLSFLSKGTDIYCSPCHDKKFAKHCFSCKKPITSGGVNYQDQPWHSHCFVCSSCSKPLAGTSFTNHQDQVFCVDCYKNSVAKKCSGCQNPITGFGKGVNVVNYEGSSWHEYCFNCKKCSLSLSNKRFVAKGRDILCTDFGCSHLRLKRHISIPTLQELTVCLNRHPEVQNPELGLEGKGGRLVVWLFGTKWTTPPIILGLKQWHSLCLTFT